MRHHVNIVLCVASAVVILCPESTSAQANWREVRSLKMGRFFARVDVSSVHTVRLYAQLDTSKLMGEQLLQSSQTRVDQRWYSSSSTRRVRRDRSRSFAYRPLIRILRRQRSMR